MRRHEYLYDDARQSPSDAYLWPPILTEIEARVPTPGGRVFDLGCGSGNFVRELRRRGYEAMGIDSSVSGVEVGRAQGLPVHVGSAYDDLAATYGQFPAVVSLEVVEHLYSPRSFAKTLFDLVEPGGVAIVSTPYHGYLKNLALALTGKMQDHLQPLCDHGHIKFWSPDTLTTLLGEAGFTQIRILRAGRRFASLAMSMIAIATRPEGR